MAAAYIEFETNVTPDTCCRLPTGEKIIYV